MDTNVQEMVKLWSHGDFSRDYDIKSRAVAIVGQTGRLGFQRGVCRWLFEGKKDDRGPSRHLA